MATFIKINWILVFLKGLWKLKCSYIVTLFQVQWFTWGKIFKINIWKVCIFIVLKLSEVHNFPLLYTNSLKIRISHNITQWLWCCCKYITTKEFRINICCIYYSKKVWLTFIQLFDFKRNGKIVKNICWVPNSVFEYLKNRVK